MFTHVVLFWLRQDAPAGERAALAQDCVELLGKIPGVKLITSGHPAMTPREVVDNSYSVGLCAILTDRAAHDVYQSHPLHLEFIARHKPYWERIRVMDFD
jgi:hypothetical protein